jgi:hypothetical protein
MLFCSVYIFKHFYESKIGCRERDGTVRIPCWLEQHRDVEHAIVMF